MTDRLLVVTDRRATAGRPLAEVVSAAIAGGARLIQLREKDLEGRALHALAVELARIAHDCGARLLINDRVDVALAAGADGVVLPADSLPVDAVRQLVGSKRMIARSTHSPEEVARAADDGADLALFGPVFATPSKAAYGAPQGIERLRQACRTPLPVLAVGGIDATNAAQAIAAGASGVAVIRAVMAAPDPAAAVREILAAIS
ncbi:MAG: thiamine-phosphate pyrophosphorylase [Candidatus Binatota bacterium]|nr:thiamine-phosphate pyrophosphorylase [Candidatus Binatota bacterium]